jgi:hypothetical protein
MGMAAFCFFCRPSSALGERNGLVWAQAGERARLTLSFSFYSGAPSRKERRKGSTARTLMHLHARLHARHIPDLAKAVGGALDARPTLFLSARPSRRWRARRPALRPSFLARTHTHTHTRPNLNAQGARQRSIAWLTRGTQAHRARHTLRIPSTCMPAPAARAASSSKFVRVGAPLLILVTGGWLGLSSFISGKLEVKVWVGVGLGVEVFFLFCVLGRCEKRRPHPRHPHTLSSGRPRPRPRTDGPGVQAPVRLATGPGSRGRGELFCARILFPLPARARRATRRTTPAPPFSSHHPLLNTNSA